MKYSGEDNLQGMEWAANYNAAIAEETIRWMRKDDKRIVDFGAGNGWLAREILKRTGMDVLCIEPAENMRAYLPTDTLESLADVENETVDFLYSSNVLEHIENDMATVVAMRRVLRPGGRVFLYLPAFRLLYSSMDKKVGHFRRYDRGMLMRLFGGGGWRVMELRYADSLGFWATLAFKVLDDKSGDFPGRSVRFYDRWMFPISRIIDKLTAGRFFGKNVMILAEKTDGFPERSTAGQ